MVCLRSGIFVALQVLGSLAPFAAGHAYLYEPPSRNLLANLDGDEQCPHCGQGGGPGNVKERGGDVWPSYLAPKSHGLCGDPFQGEANPLTLADETYLKVTYPPQRTYTAGSIVEFVVAISAHHQGHFEFRLCDKKLDATLSSAAEGQKCLDQWVLERVPPDASCKVNDPRGDCQPIDEQNKGRWYLPPQGEGIVKGDPQWEANWTNPTPAMEEMHAMRYRIPEGVSCEHCTLQWWWVSANTCLPDEDYFAYFRSLAKQGWDAEKWSPFAASSWATKENACCGPDGAGSFSEEFWNCADIAVLPASGSPTKGDESSEPGTAAPTPDGGETTTASAPEDEQETLVSTTAAEAPEVAQPEKAEEPPASKGTQPPVSWKGENLHLTHYWDCSGQGCDAATLQPWDESKYVSPPGYGPQDPNDFGGPKYGETMWLTGAASDALSALMGPDDGCCGTDPNDGGVGGCGKCILVQNPDSLHPDWTAVVMKKSRCPPWSNGCGEGMPHLDIAAPGFDNLQYSTANVCGKKAGTGFESQKASEALGRWYEKCKDTAECIDLCAELEPGMRKGCQLFAKWGWKRGDPKNVKFTAVECPSAFVKHIGSLFGPDGPREASADSPAQLSTTGAGSVATTGAPSTTGAVPTTSAALSTAAASSTMPGPNPVDESVSIQPHEPEGECLSEWAQCGGKGWKGQGSCCPGLECHEDSPWWSMCMSSAPEASQQAPPSRATTGTTTSTPSKKMEGQTGTLPGETEDSCLKAWSQCGGNGWNGQGTCCNGLQCHRDNDWWSACVPSASLAQRASSFLAPVQRHVLHEAPALVQRGSALSREGPAAEVPGSSWDQAKSDEL